MNNIQSVSDLRDTIVFLEAEQEARWQLLQQQLHLTSEGLKPGNLIKSAIEDMSSTPHLTEKILGTTTGLALGFLTRKIIIGASGSLFRSVFGTVLQFGVTNLIARNAGGIKTLSQFVNKSIFGKRKAIPENP